MGIYYEDESVTLYHGDSLEILPTLDIKADVLLTDPPYFKVKQEEWDNQWDKASEFLGWMGDFLDKAKPLLTPQASVWVFASPQMTASVERVIGERFQVLNSIRWVKERGTHSRADVTSLRSFLSPWEGIVFAEQLDTAVHEGESLRGRTLEPLGKYFLEQCKIGSKDIRDVAAELGHSPALGLLWGRGVRFPSEASYERMRAILGPGALVEDYAEIEALRDSLNREFEAARRVFTINSRGRCSTDVWDFAPVKPYKGKHPCEKPSEMLQHMIQTSTREGALILDPFAGSGSTLASASRLGRRSIGIEKDERWCEHAANRLSQGTLDVFGMSA